MSEQPNRPWFRYQMIGTRTLFIITDEQMLSDRQLMECGAFNEMAEWYIESLTAEDDIHLTVIVSEQMQNAGAEQLDEFYASIMAEDRFKKLYVMAIKNINAADEEQEPPTLEREDGVQPAESLEYDEPPVLEPEQPLGRAVPEEDEPRPKKMRTAKK